MKKLKPKILLFTVFFLVVQFFSNDFSLLDIEKTALIVSLGIDYVDDEFEVTAQIAVPQATDYASENNDAVISAKGDTIASAITEIGIKTGWFPKLSFCNLVLVGREVAENYVPSLIEYTYRSSKLLDSAVIAMCDNTAKEVLLAKTPLDAISSFALQKILIKSIDKTDAVIADDIRLFSIGYESKSKTGFMPIIKTVITEDQSNEGDSSSSAMAGVTPVSASTDGGESKDKPVVFDATGTGIFKDGKLVGEFDKTDTLSYNILTNKTSEAYIFFSRNDGADKDTLYTMRTDKHNVKISFKEGMPVVTLSASLAVKLVDEKTDERGYKVLETDEVPTAKLKSLEKYITENINKLISKSIELDADIFGLKDILYERHNGKYYSYKDAIIQNARYVVDVKVTSYN